MNENTNILFYFGCDTVVDGTTSSLEVPDFNLYTLLS